MLSTLRSTGRAAGAVLCIGVLCRCGTNTPAEGSTGTKLIVTVHSMITGVPSYPVARATEEQIKAVFAAWDQCKSDHSIDVTAMAVAFDHRVDTSGIDRLGNPVAHLGRRFFATGTNWNALDDFQESITSGGDVFISMLVEDDMRVVGGAALFGNNIAVVRAGDTPDTNYVPGAVFTIAHEVGHILGLGHDPDSTNLMFESGDRTNEVLRRAQCDTAKTSTFLSP